MTSEVLRKILVAGAAIAALSVAAQRKSEEVPGGIRPEPKRLDLPS